MYYSIILLLLLLLKQIDECLPVGHICTCIYNHINKISFLYHVQNVYTVKEFHHGKSMRHGIYMYVYNECILNATLQSTNQEEENSD